MPTLPLEPSPDRARSAAPHAVEPASRGGGATPDQPTRPGPEPDAAGPDAAGTDAAGPDVAGRTGAHPESAPTERERARWRDRRTGLIALIVVTIALWAVIAAAVGFATTM